MRSLFLCALSFAVAAPLFGWGRAGHQIVATVAARGLSPAAAATVDELLEHRTLADVAPLPDRWRTTTDKNSGNWHFVNIPRDDTAYDAVRDCKPQDSEVNNDCAVAAIEHYRQVLADTSQPADVRARALIFLVHFVGDIHQPLHTADDNDRGGNNVPVKWFGKLTHLIGDKVVPWNLHSVWDEGIIARSGLTVDAYADQLLAGAGPADALGGSTTEWVNAAYALAKSNAYANLHKLPHGAAIPLGKAYFDENLPVVNEQLLRGGLRLRELIESALATQQQPAVAAALIATVAPRRRAVTHAGPSTLYPIARLTPGATNPDITPATMKKTICNPKWSTKSIRPPSGVTTKLKLEQMAGPYGATVPQSDAKLKKGGKLDLTRCIADSANPRCYEEDHLISLELGGNPTDPKNLWPQPYAPVPGARQKDLTENYLHKQVCSGAMSLQEAQRRISTDWYAVYLDMTKKDMKAADAAR
jgi:hypothetical protein